MGFKPYKVKTLFKYFLKPNGLGMLHWVYGPYQVITNDDSELTLTHFRARSNLIPNASIWENLEMFIFPSLLKPKSLYLVDMFNLMKHWSS